MVLSSLQKTLSKLEGDKTRSQDLAQVLASRVKLAKSVTQPVHLKRDFNESGYIVTSLLGEGRFGVVKLAKKKSTRHTSYVLAAPNKSGMRQDQGDAMEFVAVRII
ncbi:unnamed protein product, partial [Polarella glacialis]